MDEPMYMYETTIELEDGYAIKITTAGPPDAEEEITDFIYQVHQFGQEDKSKYFTKLIGDFKEDSKYFTLANRARRYAEDYS
jgi:hypothetical protein